MQCPRCTKDTPEGSVVCPFCATPLDGAPASLDEAPTSLDGAPTSSDEAPTSLDEAPTSLDAGGASPQAAPSPAAVASPPSSSESSTMSFSDSGQHGRFLPGTTVAGRYRIVGLLGRGGMGEVYRGDDLKLGQQVALKFLPGKFAADADYVKRLFDEVRMARKVSHPNVCRVFDVGEADGHQYVSMEYVDGEDLASLLRRIGRLPGDKAVEIARQLCAALAAAHDEGVLHRDLKPANIMLDGRGRVKLTDFGLAAVAEVRAGTPIYMAPEQLAGEEVSIKSDLYALGLVLYELFTGKRVFDADNFDELSRQHQSLMTTSLASTSEFDPAIDRVIRRCLEADPAKRPDSALAVAAGLPGADPLAAALAAGETPSPEMVAEAGGEGSLSMAVAAPLLVFALVCAVAVGVFQGRVSLVGWVPFEMSPAMLDARANEIVAELGYLAEYVDSASAFAPDLGYINWLKRAEATVERWEVVEGGRPASVRFWWRRSPSVLVPAPSSAPASAASVTLSNPPRTTPGMISLQTDTLGRLTWLDVVPERVADGSGASPDWAKLFELMGLSMADFTPTEPRLSPSGFADTRAAWEGAYEEDPQVSLRIEAAALDGRPTSLRLFTTYSPLERPAITASLSGLGFRAFAAIFIVLVFLLLTMTAIFGALYVARRNVRSGRGDARAARRLGYAIGIILGVDWLLNEHTFSPNDMNSFMYMLLFAGAVGGLTWALYLAVEPFMRRHAPEALIGWTRLVDARFSDPLVGRDVLLGCATGALSQLLWVAPATLGERGAVVANYAGMPLATLTQLGSSITGSIITNVILALGLSFLYGLSFVALRRRRWVAFAAWLLLFGGIGFVPGISINSLTPSATTLTSLFWLASSALWLLVLFRLGILTFVVLGITSDLLSTALPTLDFTAWYAPTMTAGLAAFLGLSAYAFYRSVAWKGGLAEALAGD